MAGGARVTRVHVRRLLAAVVLGLLAVLLLASPASAHAVLVRTSPVQNSVVDVAPSDVVLTFSEPVKPVVGKIRIVGPGNERADRGDPRTNGNDVLIALREKPPEGTYLVTFRVISTDGHPIGGAFTFSIGAPSPGGPPTAESDASSSGMAVAVFPVVRYLGYAGLVLLVGAGLVLGSLWPRRLDQRAPARVVWIGAATVAVATVLELVLEVPYVLGGSIFNSSGGAWQEVLQSRFGTAHLVRLGVLGVSLLLLRPLVKGHSWGSDRLLLAVLGVVGFATWSVSGHPGASPAPMITVIADMIHIGAMSVWLGGLLMLFAFLLPQGNAVELSAIVPVWSRWATYAVGTLILTGLAQALVQIGSVSALVGTTYGWLVVVKVTLVGMTLATALVSRRMVAPIATEAPGAAHRLRMIVLYEVAILAMVLGTTSVLVQTTPARTAIVDNSVPRSRK